MLIPGEFGDPQGVVRRIAELMDYLTFNEKYIEKIRDNPHMATVIVAFLTTKATY